MISFKEKRIIGANDDYMLFETVNNEYVLVSHVDKNGWAKASKMALSFTKWDDFDTPLSELGKKNFETARYNLSHVVEDTFIDVRPHTDFH